MEKLKKRYLKEGWLTRDMNEEELIIKFEARWGTLPEFKRKLLDGYVLLGPIPSEGGKIRI